jgi:CO/xanthine dehydrogenase FAD-binding subunit
MVATIIRVDAAGRVADARIAVGSCSAKAQRLNELERALVGVPAQPGLGKIVNSQHLALLSPIDDVRATAEYRRDASLILISRALDACVGS